MSKTGSSWVGALALAVALGAQAVSVGSGGQASYGVAISVPPGVAGMSPNLALSYADGGINGPVGALSQHRSSSGLQVKRRGR